MAGVPQPSVDEIAARIAITDILHRYCRAMDRMDRDLALSCWHEGGTDEHAPLYAGTAAGFVDWVTALHAAFVSTRHILTNILIEVDGDEAWSESCWSVTMRAVEGDGLVDIFGGGRYLDHLVRIDGVWAIRHRRSIHDWDRVEPVSRTMGDGPAVIAPHSPDAVIRLPSRDGDDPSYAFLGGHARHFGEGRD